MLSGEGKATNLLRIENLRSGYGPVTVLDNVSLTVPDGEIVAIIGSNGAGKTTLLKTISGLLRSSGGKMFFDDRDITGLATHEIARLGIVHVPQGRQVIPFFSVSENLLMGAYPRYRQLGKDGYTESLERVWKLFPVLKERTNQSAGTLSGGQQQMLVVGRALMAQPRVLMLDEPSLGLAPIVCDQIVSMIRELNEKGITIVLVEQNVSIALDLAHRAYVLTSGRITLQGTTQQLLIDSRIKDAYLGGL